MHILVTGGLGYIGAHMVAELVETRSPNAPMTVVIVDNLKNSTLRTFETLRHLVPSSSEDTQGTHLELHVVDICDAAAMVRLFATYAFEVVYHLAALKSITESFEDPDAYYQTNYLASTRLVDLCLQHRVRTFIFSSSASVYGNQAVPTNGFRESDALHPDDIAHMYGKTKRMVEVYLESLAKQGHTDTTFIALRYFNPIGNHPTGRIGELLANTTEHMSLFKLLSTEYLKAHTKRASTPCTDARNAYTPTVCIFGDDYPTADGTCERDVIHVSDVAQCHVRVAQHTYTTSYQVFNVGRGFPTSVKTLVDTYASVSRTAFSTRRCERRQGDAVSSYANVECIHEAIGWAAIHTVQRACTDGVAHCHHILQRHTTED